MSKVVQGFWRLNEWKMTKEELNHPLHDLTELGITTMDHADIYGSYTCETIFGEALQLTPSLRNNMEIVTKCGIMLPSERMNFDHHIYNYSRGHINKSVDRSLTELHVNEIDLLLLHRPSPLMDVNEVAETLAILKQSGKVKHFGVSNFKDFQYQSLSRAMKAVNLEIEVNQLEVSAVELENLEDGTLHHMQQHNVGLMAWSPLGGGKIFDQQNTSFIEVLNRVADIHHTTIDCVMYAWLYKLPFNIHPIVGSQHLHRAQAALTAQNINLTDNEWFEIYKETLGRDIL